MATLTPNFRFTLPAFDVPGWDIPMNANLSLIDTILAQFNVGINLQGAWLNSQSYSVGMSVIDTVTGHVWTCVTPNMSAASPTTFATDRASNPSFWTDITNPAITALQSAINSAGSATASAASATAAAVSAAAAVVSAAAAAGSVTSAAGSATAAATSAAAAVTAITGLQATIRNYISGLTLSNDGVAPNTVLDVAAGVCVDSTNAVNISLSALTKSTAGAWVAGTGNNGMGVGLTVALNTWYHVFAVIVSGAPDIYYDTSITAANKPTSTTAFRRIGSFKTDASIHIIPFIQTGNRFDRATPNLEFTGTPGVTTAVTLTLNGVPLGVVVEAIMSGNIFDPTANEPVVYLSSLAQTDVSPAGNAAVTAQIGSSPSAASASSWSGHRIVTNASAQIRYRTNSSTAALNIITNGWIDPRGTNF